MPPPAAAAPSAPNSWLKGSALKDRSMVRHG